MAFEEVGIRLRSDGVAETTNGTSLVAKGLDAVASAAGAASPELAGAAQAAASAAGALSPLAIAAGAAAAGGGLVAFAYARGSLELQSFQAALLLTGNAAATTTGQLQEDANAVDRLVGTHAQAAAVLVQLVSTARVNRDQLALSTEAAIRLEREFGIEAEKTVKALADLGRDPLKALEKLNDQSRFLTLSTYEQIKALADQGRTQEAAALAQETYATKAIERSKEMEKNLGTLQTAWRGIKDIAAEAWDAMLGIGRKKTTQEELAAVEAALAMPARRGGDPTQQDARRKAMEERRDFLRQMLADQADAAKLEAHIANIAQQQVEADGKKKGGSTAAPADPYRALNDQIIQRLQLAAQEINEGEKLSATERTRLELMAQIQALEARGGTEAANLLRGRVNALTTLLARLDAQRESERQLAEQQKEFQADRAKATQAAEREVLTLQQGNEKLAEETAQLGLNSRALVDRQQALIENDIAERQAHINRISGLPAYAEEAAALEQQIALLRQRRGLLGEKFDAQQRKTEADENARREKDIADSIYRGLSEGFGQGNRVSEMFLKTFREQAARTLLRVPVQLISQATNAAITNGMSWLTGLFGLSGGAGGGGGLGFSGYGSDAPALTGLSALSSPSAGTAFALSGGPRVMSAGRATAPSSRQVVYSPTYHVDGTADRAETVALMDKMNRAALADFVDKLDRNEM